jgi:hypothetical protein
MAARKQIAPEQVAEGKYLYDCRPAVRLTVWTRWCGR